MDDNFAMTLQIIIFVVTAFIALVTAIIALRQVWEAKRARSIDAFLTISSDLSTPEARAARRSIYTQIRLLKAEELTWEQRECVSVVGISFDRLGVAINKGLLPADVALEMYFETVIKTWDSIKHVVVFERKQRGYETHLHNFEYLYGLCKDHANREGVEIRIFPDL
jgi:hypothetical protein